MNASGGHLKGRDSIYLYLGALLASLTLFMGLSAQRAYAYSEISVSDLELSSQYVKPSGEVELKATIANIGSDTITEVDAYVDVPNGITLLASSEEIAIGTLGPSQATTVSWRVKAPATEGQSSKVFEVSVDGFNSSYEYVYDFTTSRLSLHVDGVPPTITTLTKPMQLKQFRSRESFILSVEAKESRSRDTGIGSFRFQHLVNGSWIDDSTNAYKYPYSTMSSRNTHKYTCLNGHTCTVRTVAVDKAGNEAASQTYTTAVDTQAPVIKMDAPTLIRANKTLKIKYSAYDPSISGLSSLGLSRPGSRSLARVRRQLRGGTGLAPTSSDTAVFGPMSSERYGKELFDIAFYSSDRAGNMTWELLTIESVKAKPKFRLGKAKLIPRKGKRGKKGRTLRFTVATSKYATGRLKASIVRPKGWKRFRLSKWVKGKGKATFRFKIPRKGKRRIKVKLQFFGDKIYKKRTGTRILGCGKKRMAWCKKSSKKKRAKKKAKKKQK